MQIAKVLNNNVVVVLDEHRREQVLQNYRLAYRADTMVNWCPQLGTVLANDEVKDGL